MDIAKADVRGIERQGFQVDREFVKGLETHRRHRYWRPDIRPSGMYSTPLPCDTVSKSVYLTPREEGGKGFMWEKPPDPVKEEPVEELVEAGSTITLAGKSHVPPKKTRKSKKTKSKE